MSPLHDTRWHKRAEWENVFVAPDGNAVGRWGNGAPTLGEWAGQEELGRAVAGRA